MLNHLVAIILLLVYIDINTCNFFSPLPLRNLSMETLPSVDDSPVDTQFHQHESHRTPSESKMDETSSTLVMIAQSKALFDRLEMEAKVGSKFCLLFTSD